MTAEFSPAVTLTLAVRASNVSFFSALMVMLTFASEAFPLAGVTVSQLASELAVQSALLSNSIVFSSPAVSALSCWSLRVNITSFPAWLTVMVAERGPAFTLTFAERASNVSFFTTLTVMVALPSAAEPLAGVTVTQPASGVALQSWLVWNVTVCSKPAAGAEISWSLSESEGSTGFWQEAATSTTVERIETIFFILFFDW